MPYFLFYYLNWLKVWIWSLLSKTLFVFLSLFHQTIYLLYSKKFLSCNNHNSIHLLVIFVFTSIFQRNNDLNWPQDILNKRVNYFILTYKNMPILLKKMFFYDNSKGLFTTVFNRLWNRHCEKSRFSMTVLKPYSKVQFLRQFCQEPS